MTYKKYIQARFVPMFFFLNENRSQTLIYAIETYGKKMGRHVAKNNKYVAKKKALKTG